MEEEGKGTVLITGVSKGIGRGLALELAKRGYTIIGCSRDQTKLHSLQTQLSAISPSSPNNHFLFNADVTSDSRIKELARMVLQRNLVPDILVNNAAVINKNSKFWEIPADEFDSVIDTNVKGVANVLRHFIPLMMASGKRIIVNISAGWGRVGQPMVSAYCASKWAVEGLTKSIAKELPDGMAVIALHPGVINTDIVLTCLGPDLAPKFQSPESWAVKASTMILNFTAADNGASLTVDD